MTIPAVLRVVALLTTLALARPATADAGESSPSAALQGSLVALERSGCLVVGGRAIESSRLLSEFYRRRGFEPAWSDPSSVEELRGAIDEAERQGLDPADYHLETILRLRRERDDPRTAADLDLLATDAFVRLASDVRYGKIPTRAARPDAARTRALRTADPVGDLQTAIDAGRIHDFVESLEPATVFYRRLKDALATYRHIASAGGWPGIDAGPAVKPGQSDPRMAVLRERLVVTGDIAAGGPSAAGDLYDASLEAGVRAFQTRHGLDADGVIGPATRTALNVPVAQRIDQIRATLERCRWFLRDLPDRFVMVNVAGFRVLFIEDGLMRWKSRVIVGTPYTKTPMFRADMKYVVLNPTWTVPASIVRNEMLPAMRRDAGYLAKKRIARVGGQFVQAAGPGNALGRIKLMLPNPYSVYLHDTPGKSLFASTSRTFSHGCVRVENPVELAALALDDPAWSVEALQHAIDTGKTRTIPLGKPIPVLVLYWSVTVNREGSVEFLPDVYRRDAPILSGLAAASTSGTCR